MKWAFYIYYPLHLFVIGLLQFIWWFFFKMVYLVYNKIFYCEVICISLQVLKWPFVMFLRVYHRLND
jgi:hypothetical protein